MNLLLTIPVGVGPPMEQWIEGTYVPPVGSFLHLQDEIFTVREIHIHTSATEEAEDRKLASGYTEIVFERIFGLEREAMRAQGWSEYAEDPLTLAS